MMVTALATGAVHLLVGVIEVRPSPLPMVSLVKTRNSRFRRRRCPNVVTFMKAPPLDSGGGQGSRTGVWPLTVFGLLHWCGNLVAGAPTLLHGVALHVFFGNSVRQLGLCTVICFDT